MSKPMAAVMFALLAGVLSPAGLWADPIAPGRPCGMMYPQIIVTPEGEEIVTGPEGYKPDAFHAEELVEEEDGSVLSPEAWDWLESRGYCLCRSSESKELTTPPTPEEQGGEELFTTTEPLTYLVPEPTSLGLLLLGAGAWLVRWRLMGQRAI